MKYNYQMLGGRRGSYRPRRHSVIYMWISAPNNFSHCLPPLFGLHPLHVRNSMSFSYRLLLSSLMSTLSFATFFCLFAGFMSNSFMYDTQWITWNWLLPHITISFHRQKKKKMTGILHNQNSPLHFWQRLIMCNYAPCFLSFTCLGTVVKSSLSWI